MAQSRLGRRALMGMIAGATATSVLGSACRSLASIPTQQSQAPSADRLDYLDRARRLTVQVRVNGQGPFAFMVDTGANSSVIAMDLAARLGLEAGEPMEMHGIAGVQTVNSVRVPIMSVGRRQRENRVLCVLPRSTLGADGILGIEWLGRNNLLLDYGRRRMVVGGALPLPDSRTHAIKSRLQTGGLTLIDAYLPGRRITAFIDSGSIATVGNIALLEEASSRDLLVGGTVETELRSVTGQALTGRLAVLKSLALGKIFLRNVPLVIGPVHTFDFWGMRDEPALLLGSDILQTFDMVAMDFRAGEVRFRVTG